MAKWKNRIISSGVEAPDQLLANPLNWRVHPQDQQTALMDALEEVGWVQEVIVNQRTGHLVDGHLRVVLALRNDETEVPVKYIDVSEDEERLILATLDPIGAMATQDTKIYLELLEGIETGSAALQELLADMGGIELGAEEDSKLEAETGIENESAEAYIQQADYVLVQFSGGKDSLLALLWACKACAKYEKEIEALFIETGAEFPDLVPYIVKICKQLGVRLQIRHPELNIVQYYMDLGYWPNPIARDCIHKFISTPTKDYIENLSGEVICVRGSRPDQKTSISKSDIYQEQDNGIKVLNPLFGLNKEEYEEELAARKGMMWEGYERGFCRTACWMCPFQTAKQWDALKLSYPLLWNCMSYLALSIRFHKQINNSYRIRMNKYWRS